MWYHKNSLKFSLNYRIFGILGRMYCEIPWHNDCMGYLCPILTCELSNSIIKNVRKTKYPFHLRPCLVLLEKDNCFIYSLEINLDSSINLYRMRCSNKLLLIRKELQSLECTYLRSTRYNFKVIEFLDYSPGDSTYIFSDRGLKYSLTPMSNYFASKNIPIYKSLNYKSFIKSTDVTCRRLYKLCRENKLDTLW